MRRLARKGPFLFNRIVCQAADPFAALEMNQAQSRFRDILCRKLHRDDCNKGKMKYEAREAHRGNSDQIQGTKLKNTAGFCVASGTECAADRGIGNHMCAEPQPVKQQQIGGRLARAFCFNDKKRQKRIAQGDEQKPD